MTKNYFKNLIITMFFVAISILTGILFKTFAGFIFTLIVSIFLIIPLVRTKDYKKYLVFYIYGYIILILSYCSSLADHGTPYFSALFNDDKFFEDAAIKMNENKIWNFMSGDLAIEYVGAPKTEYTLFIFILARIMQFSDYFYGYHVILLRILNLTLSILSLLVISIIMKKYFHIPNKIADKGIYILGFTTNIYYIASYGFRDSITLFLLICAYYLIVKDFYGENKTANKVKLLILIFFIYYLRPAVTIIIVLLYIIHLLKFKNVSIKKFAFSLLLLSISIIGVTFIFLISKESMFDKYGYYESLRSTNSENNNYNALTSFIISLPLIPFGYLGRIVIGILQPFPIFEISRENIFQSLINNFQKINSIMYLTLLITATIGIKKFSKPIIVFLIVGALFTTTLTFRHAIFLYPFGILASTYILKDNIKFSRLILPIFWTFLIAFILLSVLANY